MSQPSRALSSWARTRGDAVMLEGRAWLLKSQQGVGRATAPHGRTRRTDKWTVPPRSVRVPSDT